MPSAAYPADLDEEIIEELLTYERCAAWLLDGLTAGGFVKSLPQSTVEIMRRAAMRETQSTMRALFDARELSSLAARLGIPMIPFDEALHGLAEPGGTGFPQSIGLAATWDTALMGRVAGAIAGETRSRGIRQVLTPVLNIASDVRWGRVEETYERIRI